MSGQNGRDDAARLEVALDRIARAATRPPPTALPHGHATSTSTNPLIPELAARLDDVITHLRTVLGTEI